jgi:hypothetical protein
VDGVDFAQARTGITIHDRGAWHVTAPLMSGWWTYKWRPRAGWTIGGYHSHRTCTLLNGAIGYGPEPIRCAFARIAGATAPAWADWADWYHTPAAAGFTHTGGDTWRRCPTEYNADGRRREGTVPRFTCDGIPGADHACRLRGWDGYRFVDAPAVDALPWETSALGAMVFHYASPSWPASSEDKSYRVAVIAAPSITVVINGVEVAMTVDAGATSAGQGQFVLTGQWRYFKSRGWFGGGDWLSVTIKCHVTVKTGAQGNSGVGGLFDPNLEQWEGAAAAARALPSSNNFRFAVAPSTKEFFMFFQWRGADGGTLYQYVRSVAGQAAADSITYRQPMRWLFPKCGTGQYQIGDACRAVSGGVEACGARCARPAPRWCEP